jgi:hypothetical protein
MDQIAGRTNLQEQVHGPTSASGPPSPPDAADAAPGAAVAALTGARADVRTEDSSEASRLG